MEHYYYVYILSSPTRTLYVGVTNDLIRRVSQHKRQCTEGFTKRYGVTDLVHFEVFRDIREAIAREKQIKGWDRSKKIILICSRNVEWRDLFPDITL